MAKSYLATALSQNIVPGLDTPENLKTAQQAISIFQEVLAKDPNDVNSLKQIAGIYFSIKKLDDAKTWQKKVLAVDPKDPEAAYTVGVIDWTLAHENVLKALASRQASTTTAKATSKAPKKVMEQIKRGERSAGRRGAAISESGSGEPRQLRRRNGLPEPGLSPQGGRGLQTILRAVKDDVAAAKEWSTKAMGTRKANEEKKDKGPGGITMDSSGNLK